MNYLLAKLKGRSEQIWKVASEECPFYNTPDISTNHEYDPHHTLDAGEWHKLTDFSTRGFVCPVVDSPLNTAEYEQLAKSDYSKVDYLVAAQGSLRLFQRITATHIIRKPWLSISDAPRLHKDEPIITLGFPNAIYDADEDVLYFMKLDSIKVIFNGIDTLYRAATQDEVVSFLGNEFIALGDGYSADKVKTNNRKRIASASDKLARMTDDQRDMLITYTKDYCGEMITYADEAFVIGSEEQLKLVLYGIEERYYTTVATHEERFDNSVKRMIAES